MYAYFTSGPTIHMCLIADSSEKGTCRWCNLNVSARQQYVEVSGATRSLYHMWCYSRHKQWDEHMDRVFGKLPP